MSSKLERDEPERSATVGARGLPGLDTTHTTSRETGVHCARLSPSARCMSSGSCEDGKASVFVAPEIARTMNRPAEIRRPVNGARDSSCSARFSRRPFSARPFMAGADCCATETERLRRFQDQSRAKTANRQGRGSWPSPEPSAIGSVDKFETTVPPRSPGNEEAVSKRTGWKPIPPRLRCRSKRIWWYRHLACTTREVLRQPLHSPASCRHRPCVLGCAKIDSPRAGSGTGDGSLFSIAVGRAQLRGSLTCLLDVVR
jgi:hypothetical protein